MADLDKLYAALKAADAAGNADDAKSIAQAISAQSNPARQAPQHAPNPQTAVQAPQEGFAQAIGSELKGVYTGLHRIPQSVLELGLRGTDAVGLTNGAYPMAHEIFTQDNASMNRSNSPAFKVGDVGGQIIGTLPAATLRIPGMAAKLPTLAKVADGAVQGGAASLLTSSGSDAPLGEQVGIGMLGGSALPAIGAAARGAGNAIPSVLGNLTTGAGSNSVREAFRAGLAGGEKGAAFAGSMRGKVPWSQVVDDAKTALGGLRSQRGAEYRAGMADLSKDKTVLDFAPIDDAMGKLTGVKTFKGVDLSPKTAGVRQEIADTINQWKALDPAEYHTPEGFDALKQRIGDIRDSLPFNTPERVVAEGAYNAVKSSIAQQAPEYNRVMAKYGEASDLISDIQRELSLGPKGNPNTALRKLQSVMRDNVNTSWGDRAKYASALEDAGATTLMPSLAGQALSSALPRGLAKYGDMAAGGLALAHNPAALAAAPLASPRLVGEAAYGLGSGVRSTRGALGNAQVPAMPPLPVFSSALGSVAPGFLAYQR